MANSKTTMVNGLETAIKTAQNDATDFRETSYIYANKENGSIFKTRDQLSPNTHILLVTIAPTKAYCDKMDADYARVMKEIQDTMA